jgi:hypothetical protein
MADVKISGLPASTVPLAGTEVLPIVQGGQTRQVSVNNLTAGKAVTASSVTATNLKTNPAAANLDISGSTVAAAGTDSDIDINVTPKGTGVLKTNNLNASLLTASKPVFTDVNKNLSSSGTLATDQGGTGLTSYSQGDLVYYNTGTTFTALAKNTSATRYLANTGTSNNPAWTQVNLSNGVTDTLPVANGGTNTSSAGITAFNNITGYTASGATGTTSTNLVFSTSPTITTPTVNTAGTQIATFNGYQNSVQNNSFQYDGRNEVASTSGTLTKFATVTAGNSMSCGRIIVDVIATNNDANQGYAAARSQRVIIFTKYGGNVFIVNQTEEFNQIGSANAGVISIALTTTAVTNGSNDIDLKATATATGAVGATNVSIVSQVTVITGIVANTLTMV